MSNENQITLKQVSSIMVVGGLVALGLVAAVWLTLHIFVL